MFFTHSNTLWCLDIVHWIVSKTFLCCLHSQHEKCSIQLTGVLSLTQCPTELTPGRTRSVSQKAHYRAPNTGWSEYEPKSKYAKRSAEGTPRKSCPLVHILFRASLQASTESVQRNVMQPCKKIDIYFGHFWREKMNPNFVIKCCLVTSHILLDWNIWSWFVNKNMLC